MLNDRKPIEADEQEEEDLISHAIGDYGKWQLILTFLLSLVNVPCTWHIVVPNFQAAQRETWCARPPRFSHINPKEWKNYTQPTGECQIFDLSLLNSTNIKDLSDIQNIPGMHLVDCHEWEFDGTGKI